MSQARRGDVWSSADVFDDEPAQFVIVSCDSWNRLDIREVLGVEIASDTSGAAENFSPVVTADGQQWTVFGDQVLRIPAESLYRSERGPHKLDALAMADIDTVLDRILATTAASPRRPMGNANFPYRGQIEFAELHIDDGPKPVVVISSEEYAAATNYQQVLVCRKTGDPGDPYSFDVVLTSQTGKVRCSAIHTVAVDDLLTRDTVARGVTRDERAKIMMLAREMLGIPLPPGPSLPIVPTMGAESIVLDKGGRP